MKICFCVSGMHAGGAERVISILVNEMVKQHDVSIIMVSSLTNVSFYNLDKKINVFCVNQGKRLNPIKRLRILKKYIKQIKPDVVLSFLAHVNVYTHLALKNKNIVHIVSERNDPKNSPSSRILKILKEYVFKKADGCVFQTNYASNYYSKIKPEYKKIIFNPLTVLNETYRRGRKPTKKIITVGRLVKQKNHECLLNAFALFKQKHPDYHLDIFGEGSYKNYLLQICDNLNLRDSVHFKGVSSSWHSMINEYDFFVLPSDFEGMPNALLEAMALDIPCISSDCPAFGAREFIQNKKNGMLFRPGNYYELSEMMNEILITKLSSNEFLKEMLSPNVIANEWIDFIEEIRRRNQ